MLLLQTPWTAAELNAKSSQAGAALAQARRTLTNDGPTLALLPHADGSEHEAASENELTAALGAFAKAHNLYLGASAFVKSADGVRTVGYVFGPDGKVLARNAKILPDIVEGYTDTAADTYQPAKLAVARTPLGQIGVLCGEDILSPHIVRTMMVRGAEIIFNPARERSDHLTASRLMARKARAYENLAYVALASPISVSIDGATAQLPAATGLYPPAGEPLTVQGQESVLKADIDIEGLRRRRMAPPLNFPSIVRMNIYAPGYAKEAGKARPSPTTRAQWIAEAKTRVAAQAKPAKPGGMDSYGVLLCQHVVHQSNRPEDLIPNRQKNLDDAFDLVRSYGARSASLKLVVFPEFYLTGPVSPLGAKLGHIADKIGVTFPGREMDQIAAFAQEYKCYVSGGVFEYDPEWPNRFFNTAFIYDDSGNLIHKYRKIHCGDAMGFLPVTTPGSVYDKYVAKYGYENLFPVVDTPIGRLATVICFDNNFGETHRAMVKRGAEVIIHPTSEPHGAHRGGWDAARRMRGFENTAYVLSCGHGGEYFLDGRVAPSSRARGYSKIVNFDGSLQAEADTSGLVPLAGTIDLSALRRARADIQANVALWDDPVVYAAEYAASPRGLPNNIWADDPLGNPYHAGAEIKKVAAAYVREGIFVAPASGSFNATVARAAE
ncbi:MAG: nitrilase-related carbon-nitrogen hydrolase [Rhodospirillaceae bacterium]|nr:nitrilase-related carbon-nitrogen hydrolase [Rhodospirillaceae bacterium]